MVVAVLLTKYQKAGPTVVICRDYMNSSEPYFQKDLRNELDVMRASAPNDNSFQNYFDKVFHKQPLIKTIYARGNDSPFIYRALRKATFRSHLKN